MGAQPTVFVPTASLADICRPKWQRSRAITPRPVINFSFHDVLLQVLLCPLLFDFFHSDPD
jgi:hypothetical protein